MGRTASRALAGALFNVLIDAESADGAIHVAEQALDEIDGVRVLAGPAPTHQPAIRAAFRQAGFAARIPKPPARGR
jgi:hypothetical protein